jgi:hypothetical protein
MIRLDKEVENMVHKSREACACAVERWEPKAVRQAQFFESLGRGGIKICSAKHRVPQGDCLLCRSNIGICADGSQGFEEGRRHSRRVHGYRG